jgi:MoaA/NifB/PqqE/SkfB family radical SAM enzyme
LGAAISSIDFCKVGFDSCSYPFVKQNLHFDRDSFESCEGGRKSAFISETLDVFPCSFYCGRSVSGGNLHQESLVTIVNESSLFSSHRKTKWSERSCPLFDL